MKDGVFAMAYRKMIFIMVLVSLFTISVALKVGMLAPQWPVLFMLLIAIAIYFFMLFYRPHIALFVTLLVAWDGFGFIDSSIFLRLPHIFQLKELLFIFIFLPLLCDTAMRRRRRPVASPIMKPIWFLMTLIIVQVISTYLSYNVDLNSIIRIGRRYLYYLIFPLTIYYIDTKKKLDLLIVAAFIAGLTICILTLLQSFLGTSMRVIPYAIYRVQEVGSLSFWRVTLPGASLIACIFACSFWVYLYSEDKWLKTGALIGIIFALSTIIIMFSRARIVIALVSILLPFFIVFKQRRTSKLPHHKISARITGLSLCLLALLGVSFNLWPQSELLGERMRSAVTDVTQNEGTFAYRLKESEFRVELFKRNPVLGAGFLHPERTPDYVRTSVPGKTDIQSHDTGISLLSEMGIMGIIWLLWLSFAFFKRAIWIWQNVSCNKYKGIVAGFIGFYGGSLITFITMPAFIFLDGILCFAFMMGLMEASFWIEKKHRI